MVIGISAAHAAKPERTGVEEYCFQIIQALKKTIPATERVVLYSNIPLTGLLAEIPANWEIKVLRWPFKKMWSQFRLAWEMFINPPDTFFSPGQLLPSITPRNTVTTVHDAAFRVFPQAFRFLGRWYLRCMLRFILKRSSSIIVPSSFVCNELKHLYPWIKGGNIKVVPHGYNSKQYHSTAIASDIPVKYNISSPYIITVGRLEEKKNTRRIVEAFDLVRKHYSVDLVLVGSPRVGYATVAKAIKTSPNCKAIHMLGFVPTDDLRGLVAQAQAFVFPSLHEGFGLPVLEAMAVGCPVVASSGTALVEVGGDAALYADPHSVTSIAEAIESLLADPLVQDKYRQSGLRRVQAFSWITAAEQTWEAIASQKQA